MQRRKVFLSIITTLLVVVMAACVLVACNDQKNPSNGDDPKPSVITFNDGVTNPPKTVTVEYGKTLKAEDIPTAAAKEGHTFVGWFYGDNNVNQVRPNLRPTGDINATAVYEANTVSVLFVNGDIRTKVDLKYGQKVPANKVPEVQPVAGKNFIGWFIGVDAFNIDEYVVKSDVTVNAVFDTDTFDIVFKVNADDEDVYKKATVSYGEKLAQADLPQAVQAEDSFRFDGWVNIDDEEDMFDADDTFTAAKTYVAKFTKIEYIVTYVFAPEAHRENEVQKFAIESDGKATVSIVPTASAQIGGKDFVGFYCGNVKLIAGTTKIEEDCTFTAYYVGESDYAGAWVNEDQTLMVYFDAATHRVVVGKMLDETYTFNTGVAKYTATYGTSWEFVIFDNTLSATATSFSGEASTYTFTKGEAVDFAGTYVLDKGKQFIVAESGILVDFGDAKQFAKLTLEDEVYSIVYILNDGDEPVTVPVTVDEKGNIVITGNEQKGIWVKNSTVGMSVVDNNGSNEIIMHNVGGEKVFVFKSVADTTTFSYVTADKALALNAIVTVTLADESEIVIKVISETRYAVSGAEKGVYTAEGQPSFELDGFGTATNLNESEGSDNKYFNYRMNSDTLAVLTTQSGDMLETALVIDKEHMTYTVQQADNFQGKYTKNTDDNYVITVDGFGKIIALNKVANVTRYGTYTVDSNGAFITISGLATDGQSMFADGVYTAVQNGEFLYNAGDGIREPSYWGVDGATLETPINNDDFVGYWVFPGEYGDSTIEITLNDTELVAKVDGYDIPVIKNTDGSITLTEGGSYSSSYRLSAGALVEGVKSLNVVYTSYNGDVDNRVYKFTTVTPDTFIGTWESEDGNVKLMFTKTSVQAKLGESAELVAATLKSITDDNSIVITVGTTDYTVTANNGSLTIVVDSQNVTLGKTIVTDEDWIGTWQSSDGATVLVINSSSATLNGNPVTDLAVDETYGDITFKYDGTSYTFESSGFGSNKTYTLTGGASDVVLTKQTTPVTPPDPDTVTISEELDGTWVDDDGTITLVVDVTAKTVSLNGTPATGLRADTDKDIYFTVDGVEYNFYKPGYGSPAIEGGTIYRTSLTKQTTPVTIDAKFEGTWVHVGKSITVVVDTEANTITYNNNSAKDLRVEESEDGYSFTIDGVDGRFYLSYDVAIAGLVLVDNGLDRSELTKQTTTPDSNRGWEGFKIGVYTATNYDEGDITVEITENSIIIDRTTYTTYDEKSGNTYKFGYDEDYEEWAYILEYTYGWTITDDYGDEYKVSGLTKVE